MPKLPIAVAEKSRDRSTNTHLFASVVTALELIVVHSNKWI